MFLDSCLESVIMRLGLSCGWAGWRLGSYQLPRAAARAVRSRLLEHPIGERSGLHGHLMPRAEGIRLLRWGAEENDQLQGTSPARE